MGNLVETHDVNMRRVKVEKMAQYRVRVGTEILLFLTGPEAHALLDKLRAELMPDAKPASEPERIDRNPDPRRLWHKAGRATQGWQILDSDGELVAETVYGEIADQIIVDRTHREIYLAEQHAFVATLPAAEPEHACQTCGDARPFDDEIECRSHHELAGEGMGTDPNNRPCWRPKPEPAP